MLKFVNAKINIGLQIVGRREDGYHNLQTVFYPVGKYVGTPENPDRFCDILELAKVDKKSNEVGAFSEQRKLPRFRFRGRDMDCPLEKNLVYKAAALIFEHTGADLSDLELTLEKHLPDGAGMGGGSADGSETLKILAEECIKRGVSEECLSNERLLEMALRLGADCPFFMINRPCYASGVGERLERIALDLRGYWLCVVKPSIYISTKEAFSGVKPQPGEIDLRTLPTIPVSEWRGIVKNDFEESIFPLHPEIAEIKEMLYLTGALYASMSGSGSSVYGIFEDRQKAAEAENHFKGKSTIEGSYLLKM